MANLLSRFNQTVAGSNSKLADYSPKIAPVGDFERITGINVILNSWNNILVTPKRTYVFDPEYGSDLYKMVFEPADDITVNKVIEEVTETLSKYDDRATIEGVSVTFFPNLKGFTVAINVNYQGETGQLAVAIDEAVYFKFLESSQSQ